MKYEIKTKRKHCRYNEQIRIHVTYLINGCKPYPSLVNFSDRKNMVRSLKYNSYCVCVCVNQWAFSGSSHLQVLVLSRVAGVLALQSKRRGGAWSPWSGSSTTGMGPQKVLTLWFNRWTRNLHEKD